MCDGGVQVEAATPQYTLRMKHAFVLCDCNAPARSSTHLLIRTISKCPRLVGVSGGNSGKRYRGDQILKPACVCLKLTRAAQSSRIQVALTRED